MFSGGRVVSPAMKQGKSSPLDPLLLWMCAQAEKTSWAALALEVGEKEDLVYSWYRRKVLPRWHRRAVEDAKARIERKEAA